MRSLRTLMLLLALGGSLTLVACGGQSTTAICFGPRPVSSVHPDESTVSFAMTIVRDTHTYTYVYSVPKSAFGGAPAAMKNGDIVAFCAETVDSGGQSATTITQFSDQGQPATTGTPPSS
ncbi:MAG TPA: hypothetical protein VFW17_01365 [Ktedonobacterales bacterium]|jgi:hypothetical protein|nr:hypothetical protein [Ktedonobacterales bacterium]